MSLKRIRLELARGPEFPEGSARRGYEFVAPLGRDGHIDAAAWTEHRARCTVRRFWEGEDDLEGHLVRHGSGWAFHYAGKAGEAGDEPGYKFASHAFIPSQYVSITEQDGRLRTFKVIAAESA